MKITYHVTLEEAGWMVKDLIKQKGISRKALKRIKAKGKILCNGEARTVRYCVQEQDTIVLVFPVEKSTIKVEDMPLVIHYEDTDYMVVDKPVNMPCIPTTRYPQGTLANVIVAYYQKQHIQATVHLVNRLDKETKGLLLVAKHSYAHHLLSKNIQQIERIYHCLVVGHMEGEGCIEAAITRQEGSMKRRVATTGKYAVTRYRALQHFKNMTLVECQLETGRTHQIRVHMAHIGHPLVSDPLYGKIEETPFYLESVQISFVQPLTHKEIRIIKHKA